MNPPEANDPLDALLRESDAYIEDQGFTARVMDALPPRRRTWLRSAILFGAALIGFTFIAWWLPPARDIFVTAPDGGLAVQFNLQSLLTAGALLVATASLIWGVIAAVRWED